MTTWQEKARALMREQKVSVKELAATLSMTPGGAGHYLSGRRQPRPGMLVKIAKRLGVSVSELIEDDPTFARDETERAALDALRAIPEPQRSAALAMLRGLASPSADEPTD